MAAAWQGQASRSWQGAAREQARVGGYRQEQQAAAGKESGFCLASDTQSIALP